MGDVKLFQIGAEVSEIEGTALAVEKSLQTLLERHLDTFLGVRFLASEYSTGKTHGGRIDTLGIDENNCPVIIEYKRALNENVINQGLFYLDWLMDHKAEFQILVMKKLGHELSEEIEWSSPRLLCIAGDFTKYDEHAVQQINRNIELIRYKKFGNNLLMLELVNSTSTKSDSGPSFSIHGGANKTVAQNLKSASKELQDVYEAIDTFLLALGDDVQVKQLKHYIAYKRIKNFATLAIYPSAGTITVWLKLNPDDFVLETNKSFLRDVRNIGHHGTGDLEVSIKNINDFERAKELFVKSYEIS